MPVLLLMIVTVAQFALWYHGAHVVLAAAQDGARAARVEGGTADDGRVFAQDMLVHYSRIVVSPTITADRDDDVARVEIRAYAPSLVPGLQIPIHAVSSAKVERFRAEDEAP